MFVLDFKRYGSAMGTIARIPAAAINLKTRNLTQLIPPGSHSCGDCWW
jgi:hypothetical protein